MEENLPPFCDRHNTLHLYSKCHDEKTPSSAELWTLLNVLSESDSIIMQTSGISAAIDPKIFKEILRLLGRP